MAFLLMLFTHRYYLLSKKGYISHKFYFFSQEAFMENYFASQRDNIFRNVEVLIYVFDVESRELEKVQVLKI